MVRHRMLKLQKKCQVWFVIEVATKKEILHMWFFIKATNLNEVAAIVEGDIKCGLSTKLLIAKVAIEKEKEPNLVHPQS